MNARAKRRWSALMAGFALVGVSGAGCDDSIAVPVELRNACEDGVFDEDGGIVPIGSRCHDAAGKANVSFRTQSDVIAADLVSHCEPLAAAFGSPEEGPPAEWVAVQAADACSRFENSYKLPLGVTCGGDGLVFVCADETGENQELVMLLEQHVPPLLAACDAVGTKLETAPFIVQGFSSCASEPLDGSEQSCVDAHLDFAEQTVVRLKTLSSRCLQIDYLLAGF